MFHVTVDAISTAPRAVSMYTVNVADLFNALGWVFGAVFVVVLVIFYLTRMR